jgi:hypothetical protein
VSGNVTPARRYYLLKRLAARHAEDLLETHWRAEQLAQPGTALPAGFPSKAKLEAVGYVAAEDLDGAECQELRDEVGLNERQAQSAIDAAAALL